MINHGDRGAGVNEPSGTSPVKYAAPVTASGGLPRRILRASV
jgi:hypothetical protein